MSIFKDRTTQGVFVIMVRIWGLAIALIGVFMLGQYYNQQSIEQRVNDIKGHCYTEYQLEYIIFGDIQE
jgi:hypothetical protein